LAEEIGHVRAGAYRRTDDRRLAGELVAAAQPVDLALVRTAQKIEQELGELNAPGRHVRLREENALAGSTAWRHLTEGRLSTNRVCWKGGDFAYPPDLRFVSGLAILARDVLRKRGQALGGVQQRRGRLVEFLKAPGLVEGAGHHYASRLFVTVQHLSDRSGIAVAAKA
jgi:hypothetical protein